MKVLVIHAIAATLLISGTFAQAGAFATEAIPTSVSTVQGVGFVIRGSFGNPNACQKANELFVKSDHAQYKQMFATALTAYVSKKKLSAYADGCEAALFLSGNSINYVNSLLEIKD